MQRRLTDPLSSVHRDSATGEGTAGQPQGPTSQSPRTLPRCMQSGAPMHDAQALTGGGNVAHITLNDQLYVLRITRAGKLILTK